MDETFARFAFAGQRRVTRRRVLVGAARVTAGGTLAAVLARRGIEAALAQGQGTAAAGMSPSLNMNYPELTVTIVNDKQTGQAFQVSPAQIPAGYVLINGINNSSAEGSVGLLGPGPGQTMQDLMQAAATPSPSNAQFPPFFSTATLPGGPATVPVGGSSQAIVHLTPGPWALWGGSESSNPPPVFFTATPGSPTAQTPPAATVTITEVDFAFGGFGQAIPAGKQIWKVVNQGTQPHMLSLSRGPASMTLAQVLAAVSQPPNATPTPGGLTQQDFQDVGGIILQSPGETAWAVLDLPAGRYAALCFMTDPRTGMPHAALGMAAVFDAGAAGTPAA